MYRPGRARCTAETVCAARAARIPSLHRGNGLIPVTRGCGRMRRVRVCLLGHEMARGPEVTIFDPRLYPDGSLARQLSDLIAGTIHAARQD
jgi:hypothetical protein